MQMCFLIMSMTIVEIKDRLRSRVYRGRVWQANERKLRFAECSLYILSGRGAVVSKVRIFDSYWSVEVCGCKTS